MNLRRNKFQFLYHYSYQLFYYRLFLQKLQLQYYQKHQMPNKSKGHITKIEYHSTPVTQKWFNIPVDKNDYQEIRITIEYEGQKDPSTKQLFGED